MNVKKQIGLITLMVMLCSIAFGQTSEIHLGKLVLNKKEKKIFNDRDSSTVVYIDTLIMKDKSSLQFYGKKDVKLIVKHAEIGDRAFISGMGAQNNASNFDVDINFKKLGSLYVIARGQDANNGMRTYPNGDAGNVTLVYDPTGITPQKEDKKQKNYLYVDVTPGGLHVIPNSEISNIYSRIAMSSPGLRGLPQGQIYSGSPGKEGKVIIKSK